MNNMTVVLINNDLHPSHLSNNGGWNYVLQLLRSYLPELEEILTRGGHSGERVLIDTYVDKTFLWGNQFRNTHLSHSYRGGYTDPWIGIIHHPFEVPHSCEELLSNSFRR